MITSLEAVLVIGIVLGLALFGLWRIRRRSVQSASGQASGLLKMLSRERRMPSSGKEGRSS